MLHDLRMFWRFAKGLKGFLREPVSLADCRNLIEIQLRNREQVFLRLLETAVYGHIRSPYRRLLRHAGVEYGDIAKLVHTKGISAALDALYQAGVSISLDEFKGHRPIRRKDLEFTVQPKDFDNPLLSSYFEARTGASRGVGRRTVFDFDLLRHDAAYQSLFLANYGMSEAPAAIWRPVPPGAAGLRRVLMSAKHGNTMQRWFSQSHLNWSRQGVKSGAFTLYAVYAGRLWAGSLPTATYTPMNEAIGVARWMAEMTRRGTPASLDSNVSSVVRICRAAQEHGLDISGSLFGVASEPFTPARARIVKQTGARAGCHYAMAEAGTMGEACALAAEVDDVHVLADKMEMIQKTTAVGRSTLSVDALYLTSLLLSAPKIMLNVECDDYGIMESRSCGCLFGELGFDRHIHSLRSYEKLTSEGMHFLGNDLLTLVDEVLPRELGGDPADYQFVEEDVEGLPRIDLLICPRVGDIDEQHAVDTVLRYLGRSSQAERMMAEIWGTGRTMQVIRREPYVTSAAKILPLHILA